MARALSNLNSLISAAKAAEAAACERAAQARERALKAALEAAEQEVASNGHLLNEAANGLTPGQTRAAILEKDGLLEGRIRALQGELRRHAQSLRDLEVANSAAGQEAAELERALKEARSYGLQQSSAFKEAEAELASIRARMEERKARIKRAFAMGAQALERLEELGAPVPQDLAWFQSRVLAARQARAKAQARQRAEEARRAKEEELKKLLARYSDKGGGVTIADLLTSKES